MRNKEFYYGMNFEFSWNQRQWEHRPTAAKSAPSWDGISTTAGASPSIPSSTNDYKGGIAGLEFVPATRLDYKLNDKWTVAAEEYDDFGQLRRFVPAKEQFHKLWATFDYTGMPVSIETGIGFGLDARNGQSGGQADVHERPERREQPVRQALDTAESGKAFSARHRTERGQVDDIGLARKDFFRQHAVNLRIGIGTAIRQYEQAKILIRRVAQG